MVYYFSSEKHDAHIDFSKKLSSFSIQQMHFHIQSLLCVLAVTAQQATVLDH